MIGALLFVAFVVLMLAGVPIGVALGLGGVVGNLLPGCEADFIAINPRATPLLARRTAQAGSLDELLFALIVLGDDRAVAHTLVQGQVLDPVLHS